MGSPSTTRDRQTNHVAITQQEYKEYCHHSPMLKTAQFTSYRLAHRTPSFYRPLALSISHTSPLQQPCTESSPIQSHSLHTTTSPLSKSKFQQNLEEDEHPSEAAERYKMEGNKENKPPKHEMVHFHRLLSSQRRFGEFRRVLHTGLYSQLVAMEVPMNGEIGDEVHTVDQILLFTSGKGLATVAGKDQEVAAGDVVIVPAGTQHQFVTRGDQPLELITVYSPAEHDPKTVHKTKEEGDKEEDEGRDEAPAWSRKSKKENEDAGLVKLSGKYDE